MCFSLQRKQSQQLMKKIRKMLRATYPKDHSSRERKIAVSWTIFVQAFAGRYQRYVQNLQELAIFIVRE